jgi:hypothetical protein
MDLIVGHIKQGDFPTCVFKADYNSCIASGRHFASVAGEEIQVLAVFLGKGNLAPEIQATLQRELPHQTIGWYRTSPGEIVDVIHHILCPTSVANLCARSLDKQIAPPNTQSDVPAAKAKPARRNEPRVRVRKLPESVPGL